MIENSRNLEMWRLTLGVFIARESGCIQADIEKHVLKDLDHLSRILQNLINDPQKH